MAEGLTAGFWVPLDVIVQRMQIQVLPVPSFVLSSHSTVAARLHVLAHHSSQVLPEIHHADTVATKLLGWPPYGVEYGIFNECHGKGWRDGGKRADAGPCWHV